MSAQGAGGRRLHVMLYRSLWRLEFVGVPWSHAEPDPVLMIDGKPALVTAVAEWAGLAKSVVVFVPFVGVDEGLAAQFRRGRTLALKVGVHVYSFDLTGTSVAMLRLNDCVVRYRYLPQGE